MRNKLKKFIRRLKEFPSGILLLPLLLGSLAHTFAPGALEIGSFTTALFSASGAATLMALQLFCIGAQIRLRSVSTVLLRGGVLLGARVAAGIATALLFRLFAKGNMIAGISILAAVAAVSNTNGSVLIAVTSLFGDKEAAAAAPLLALSNGPFLTALILGVSGDLQISWLSFLALVLPMLFGLLLGNISAKAAAFLAPGAWLTLPFIGFALGAGIDLHQLWQGGAPGLLLSLFTLVFGGGIALIFDRLFNRKDGAAGIAASATGANAIAVPAAIALTNPVWQQSVSAATAQISAAVIIGAILVPILAQWRRRSYAQNHPDVSPE